MVSLLNYGLVHTALKYVFNDLVIEVLLNLLLITHIIVWYIITTNIQYNPSLKLNLTIQFYEGQVDKLKRGVVLQCIALCLLSINLS